MPEKEAVPLGELLDHLVLLHVAFALVLDVMVEGAVGGYC